MHRSELQEYGGDEPIWGFVAQLGAERFTGQADVGDAPRVHLYAAEGNVYLAERDGDAPVGSRLVASGALSDEQLQRGGVHLGDSVSLSRLFHRDPSIDRDLVRVTLGKLNDDVLEAVANVPVGLVVLAPLRHHPSGVHQWNAELPPPSPADARDPSIAALVAAMGTPTLPSAPAPAAEVIPARDIAPEIVPEPAIPVLEQPAVVLPTLGAVGSWVSPHTGGTPVTPGVAQFDPEGLDHLDLPKLATRPMSVGEITTANAVVQAEREAAELEAVEAASFPLATLSHTTSGIPSFETLLETPATDWSAPVNPPAAQEIWEMVDELLGVPHTDADLVSAGHNGTAVHDDKKGRSWLRGKKG
ncbi:MAG: hypothetical protein RJA49_1164 [Actinomycetota bacterium]|jgi:hypothetical protein